MKDLVTRQDVLFSSIFSGTLAGGVIALFFLGVDAVRGDAFFTTPSLLGSVLFLGQTATEVSVVRVDMMALYTVVHGVTFIALGTVFTIVYEHLVGHLRHPAVLGLGIFFAMSAGMFVMDALVPRGVLDAIGPLAILGANALTSGVMAWLIHAALEHKDAHVPELLHF